MLRHVLLKCRALVLRQDFMYPCLLLTGHVAKEWPWTSDPLGSTPPECSYYGSVLPCLVYAVLGIDTGTVHTKQAVCQPSYTPSPPLCSTQTVWWKGNSSVLRIPENPKFETLLTDGILVLTQKSKQMEIVLKPSPKISLSQEEMASQIP